MKVQLLVVAESVDPPDLHPLAPRMSAVIGGDTSYTVTAPSISANIRAKHVDREKAIDLVRRQIREMTGPKAEWVEIEV
jgi:hypothetical protein